MPPPNVNGTGMWVRWALGITLAALLAANAALSARVWAISDKAGTNAKEVSRNAVCIENLVKRLDRMEGKLDLALGFRTQAAVVAARKLKTQEAEGGVR